MQSSNVDKARNDMEEMYNKLDDYGRGEMIYKLVHDRDEDGKMAGG